LSSLIVKVTKIADVKPHPNADRLDLAVIGGWQTVTPRGQYKTGDKVVYMPPDTMIPRELADKLGVTQYLSFGKDNPDMGRIRCAKLRGEPSYGLVFPPDKPWPSEEDVADYYGAKKYIPPVRVSAGDAMADDPLFVLYTNIENLRNFPSILQEGEEVWVTEKVHGSHSRLGCIKGETMAGSNRLRRKPPASEADWAANLYWYPLTIPGVRRFIKCFGYFYDQVMLFGEIYGKGVQDLQYGQSGLAYVAFDVLVNGQYCNHGVFLDLCREYEIPHVPYEQCEFSMATIRQKAEGRAFQGNHVKEGVVIRPKRERTHPAIGRVILKYVGDDYLIRHKEDFTDE